MAAGNLIDGRSIARQLLEELAPRIAALKARGTPPGLAFVRVGEDPASTAVGHELAGQQGSQVAEQGSS